MVIESQYSHETFGNLQSSPTVFELASLFLLTLYVSGYSIARCMIQPRGGEWLVCQHEACKKAESAAYDDALRVRVDNVGQKNLYLWLRKVCSIAVRLVDLTLGTW